MADYQSRYRGSDMDRLWDKADTSIQQISINGQPLSKEGDGVNIVLPGFMYRGLAYPNTMPVTDGRVFYMASQPGTYVNFGGIVIGENELAVLIYDGGWSKSNIALPEGPQGPQGPRGEGVEDFVEKTLDIALADGTSKRVTMLVKIDAVKFEVIGEGTQTISLNKQLTGEGEKVEYSFDGINWEDMPYVVSANDAARIEGIARDKVAAMVANGTDDVDGDLYSRVLDEEYANAELTESVPGAVSFTGKVYVRAKMPRWGDHLVMDTPNYGIVFGDNDVKVRLSGDIGYLLDWENPSKSLISSAFAHIFRNQQAIKDASALLLHDIGQASGAYYKMFLGCTSLVNAPALPATTQAIDYCCLGMFYGCTSLVNAPALPATTLKSQCYRMMFYNCTSLVNAPALPAATLKSQCYRRMFFGCSNINSVECHATDISATDCTLDWLLNVSPTGIFHCPESMADVWQRGRSGIPTEWTIQAI